jgi:ABC-type uncharacterized transport system fused permease/ATPase subunit
MTSDMIEDVLKSAIYVKRQDIGGEDGAEILEELNAFRARFVQLQNLDLSNNNRIRLLCRQLKRLVDNNEYWKTRLRKNYDLKDLQLDVANRQSLEKKLKCIEIRLEFSNRHLTDKSNVYSARAQLKKPLNSNPNDFFTSASSKLAGKDGTKDIIRLLETERWLVILGDPANGKTTMVRSLMYIYAEKFYHRHIKYRYYTESIA